MAGLSESERRNAWTGFHSSALCGLTNGKEYEDEEDEEIETDCAIAAVSADFALAEYEARVLDGEFKKPWAEPAKKKRRSRDEDGEEE